MLKLNNTQSELKTPIQIEFGKLKDVMDWCRVNCTSNWHITEVNTGLYPYEIMNLSNNINNFIFEFDNEKDLVIFNLKWK